MHDELCFLKPNKSTMNSVFKSQKSTYEIQEENLLTVLSSISECFQNDKTYKVSGFKACGYIVGTEYVHSSSTRNISRMLRVLCFQEKEIRCGNTKLYLDFFVLQSAKPYCDWPLPRLSYTILEFSGEVLDIKKNFRKSREFLGKIDKFENFRAI